MTRKELVLRMVQKLDDDVSYERVIYHLGVMKGVEIGLEQAARGEGIDHDELFAELLGEHESQGRLDSPTSARSSKDSRTERPRRSPNGGKVRKPTSGRHRKAKAVS